MESRRRNKTPNMIKTLTMVLIGCLLIAGHCDGLKWLGMKYHRKHKWSLKDCISKNFNNKITRFCYQNLKLMKYIFLSGQLTKRECKEQLRDRRWDCSAVDKSPNYDVDLREDTKESAFVHALFSASLVFSISRACMTGAVKDCQCPKKFAYLPQGREVEEVRFSQCSDFVAKGMLFAKKFTDAAWKRKRKFRLSNEIKLHNSKAGRQVVRSLQTVDCRCHGASASCAVRSCWRRLPLMKDVTEVLVKKYDKAVKVLYDRTRGFLAQWEEMPHVRPADLIYGFDSPTYCESDRRYGVTGTQGRECNITSSERDSCDRLCCGRGYNIRRVQVIERCRCKYYWCCYVKCKQCATVKDIATCK